MSDTDTKKSYGAVGFGDVRTAKPKDVWLKLKPGQNRLRLICEPYKYRSHKMKEFLTDKFAGKKVGCAEHEDFPDQITCPICLKIEPWSDKDERKENLEKAMREHGVGPAQTRYYVYVINRATTQVELWDMPWSVYNELVKLDKDPEWGNCLNYDIKVVVNKESVSDYYTVTPCKETPLTAEEQVLRDNVNLDGLEKRIQPPKPADVQKAFDDIRSGKFSKNKKKAEDSEETEEEEEAPKPKKTAQKAQPKKVEPAPAEDEDGDDDFSDYDSK
jgi:hypothetical protein